MSAGICSENTCAHFDSVISTTGGCYKDSTSGAPPWFGSSRTIFSILIYIKERFLFRFVRTRTEARDVASSNGRFRKKYYRSYVDCGDVIYVIVITSAFPLTLLRVRL